MRSLAFLLVASCVVPDKSVGVDPGESSPPVVDGSGETNIPFVLPDVQCVGTPDAGPAENFRHFSSHIVVAVGDPRHHGRDLVASADDTVQVLRGTIAYTAFNTKLVDEDVDVYACRQGAWEKLGRVATDGDGEFTLSLRDDDRLPVGMRDMFVSVAGDRTGVRFLTLVAPPDDVDVAITDVAGTLTAKEDSDDVADGAIDAWEHVDAVPVYLAGDDKRLWLVSHAMRRGPLVDTAELSLPVRFAVGNRAADIDTFARAGLPPDRIFIKLPEFSDEVAPKLANHEAVGFVQYPGPLH